MKVRLAALCLVVGAIVSACSNKGYLVVFNDTGGEIFIRLDTFVPHSLSVPPGHDRRFGIAYAPQNADLELVAGSCTYFYDLPDLSEGYVSAGAPGTLYVNVQIDESMRAWLLPPLGAQILKGVALRAAQEPGFPVAPKARVCPKWH